MLISKSHEILAQLDASFNKSKLERLETTDIAKYMDESLLKSLRRISKKLNFEENILLINLYIKLFKELQTKDLNLLITLSNDAINIGETLKGSEYNDEIEYRVYLILTNIIKTEVLAQNQFQVITDLLEKYQNNEIKEELEIISEDIHEGQAIGVDAFISLFCSFHSYREQFICLESSLNTIIDSFKSINSVELYIQVFNFLNIVLVSPIYRIDYMGTISSYYPNTIIYYTLHEHSFKSIFSIFSIVLDADIAISRNLMQVIPKI